MRIFEDLIQNSLETLAKSVRANGGQLDVGDRETVLEAVLLAGHKAGQLVAVAHQVTELSDISRGA